MKISVLIPTWKRPKKLALALESIQRQSRPADQVVCIYRDVDPEAKKVIDRYVDSLPITIKMVTVPGVIHAENEAILSSTGDIICFLDDDAEAPSHWLEFIENKFKSLPNLGGIGGPDLITEHYDPNYRKYVDIVGKVLP